MYHSLSKTSSNGDSATSLGKLFQWMIILTVEKISYVETKAILVQLVPAVPCILPVATCEERASFLFAATLYVLEYGDESLSEPSLSRKKRHNSFSLSSQGKVSNLLIISMALLWNSLSFVQSICVFLELWGKEEAGEGIVGNRRGRRCSRHQGRNSPVVHACSHGGVGIFLQLVGRIMLEQMDIYGRNCGPQIAHAVTDFSWSTVLMERTHTGAGGKTEDEGAAERDHYVLIATFHSPFPCTIWVGKVRVLGIKELGKKGGV